MTPSQPGADSLELVRTSGVCCACDHRFTDELVYREFDRGMPGGWVYLEPRHLLEADEPEA